jgi:eukaryotic-like serine/threonine-protein kinase
VTNQNQAGTKLCGRFVLIEKLGAGGYGEVWRARDELRDTEIAVKILYSQFAESEPAWEVFQREFTLTARLNHPGVLRVYEPVRGADATVLPMVLAGGGDLRQMRGAAYTKILPLLIDIAAALEHAHARRIVHRDLKPSNILLATEAGTEIAKVTDFGLVKLVEMNLQRTAALAGASLGYAPPEQYEQGNQRVSPRTDVFSLAAVVYEMLSGKPAFPFNEGENPLLIVTRILNGPRPALIRVRNALAPELEGATPLVEALDRELTRALAADPSQRHESVMEFWKAIEPALKAAAEDKPQPPPRSQVSGFDTTARVENNDAKGSSAPSAGRAAGSGVQMRNAGVAISMPAMGGSAGAAAAALLRPTPMPPSPDRVNEAQAASPAAWTWTTLTTALAPSSIRGVVFRPSGDAAIAVSSSGLMRWERGAWSPVSLPGHVPRASVRGLRWLPDGSILLFGEGGLVARVAQNGVANLWRVPDPEITFLGAYADASGSTTLVGERPYRGGAARNVPGTTAGVVAQFSGDRVTLVSDAINSTRLRGVTRLASGAIVACGDWGAIERIELGIVEHIGSICGGHLAAIAPLPNGGAVTVGVGGHALSLNAKLEAQLEAVQTTRDLMSLATTEDGQAWAGSAQARLMRRSTLATPGWVRMSGDIGVSSSMVAVWAAARAVRAIGDDGAVVEGRIA